VCIKIFKIAQPMAAVTDQLFTPRGDLVTSKSSPSGKERPDFEGRCAPPLRSFAPPLRIFAPHMKSHAPPLGKVSMID
jgi:hypothetical protein